MTFPIKPPPARRSRLAGLAVKLAVFAAVVTVYAALLVRLRAVDAVGGLGAFFAGLVLAAAAAMLGFAAMVVVWRTGLKGGVRALSAVVVAALTLAGPTFFLVQGSAVAALTDVSTDLRDPPTFEHAAKHRRPGENAVPPSAIPPAQAEAQRAAYADLAPLHLAISPDEASNLAIGLVVDRGWRVSGRTSFPRGGPPTGRIEAVATTRVLGLEEDVSIRVRPDGDGAVVDMRSASRIGDRDFGSNAARVRSFLADLATAANASQ